MNYVFGPVLSRRLGRSLGIDPVPLKMCNWNCVYCQLGRTRRLTNIRKAYAPQAAILAEIRRALQIYGDGAIDWLTFVGSGETTLNSDLGLLIRRVKDLTRLPVAVITNGSLLSIPEVRAALAPVDAVLPTLDAADDDLYRRINRPHPACSLSRHLDGLRAFRREYSGKLWVEMMLLQGMNDHAPALQAAADALGSIHPDRVHLLLPNRPPAEGWVQPADDAGVKRALDILGDVAQAEFPQEHAVGIVDDERLEDAIFAILRRHPMREAEIASVFLDCSPEKVVAVLAALEAGGRIQKVERYGCCFYSVTGAYYPDNRCSRAETVQSR